jgi:hypothetical protein
MKKGNVEAIKAKAIEGGYLVESTTEGVKKYKSRSLREVLEHKLVSKEMTKKAILVYLADRAKKPAGAREKAKIEGLVKHFTDFRVKETTAEAAEAVASS